MRKKNRVKTVILHHYEYGRGYKDLIFSSTKTLLQYYKELYPKAKNLRIREHPNFLLVLNHNSPINYMYTNIRRVEVDEPFD